MQRLTPLRPPSSTIIASSPLRFKTGMKFKFISTFKPHLSFFHADFFIECRKYTSHSIERSAPHPPLDEGVPPDSPNSTVMLNRSARARAAPRHPCPPPPARDELAAEVYQTLRNPGQGHPLKLLSVSSCLSGKVGKNARLHRHPCGERFLGATVIP